MAGLLEPESPEKFGLKDKHVLLVLGTAKKKAFRGTHRIREFFLDILTRAKLEVTRVTSLW